ncbi:MAG: 50S ribosomal protein L21 [Deltaproteobacteria bacterium]|jgi:large subunit ribosomal protein L21|nr:50S ribosomal protein L21 [Deltaproteobacteria bacterium]
MFAIIQSGGRQYKVTEGQVVWVNTIQGALGTEVVLDEVLLVNNGEAVIVGKPNIDEAKVKAQLVAHGRDKKILVFKKKRRKGYHKAQGHRQNYTALKILSIEA